MIPWKQRMYAFLLRRVLGPFLDSASLQQLHESLDVSLYDGRCTLTDIALNVDYLREKLKSLPLRIRSARIQTLTVELKLQESISTAETTSSLAWRALQLGSTQETPDGTPRISLFANVELGGVVLEVEPHVSEPSKESDAEESSTPTTATKSILSSYLDAALSSLQLSLSFKNIAIRLWSGGEQDCISHGDDKSWVEIRCQAISYQTIPSSDDQLQYETTLHKVLNLQQISVLLGSSEDSARRNASPWTVALLEGSNRVSLRLIEYRSQRGEEPSPRRIQAQQDIEVSLNQKLNVSVDTRSLGTLQTVLQRVRAVVLAAPADSPAEESSEPVKDEIYDATNDEDASTLTSIMRQYQQAKQLVERNEYRGGVLIPSQESADEVTFDAFFDANDASMYHYSTVLRESIMVADHSLSDDRWIHTRFRFHLPQGGIKVVFPTSVDDSRTEATQRHEEYILLTFHDMNASASLSNCSYEGTFSVDHMDVEDSLFVPSIPEVPGKRVEIGSIMRFVSRDGNADILVQSPCLSVNVVKQHSSEAESSIGVEIEMDPIEMTYSHATVEKASSLISTLASATSEVSVPEDVKGREDCPDAVLRLSAVCPSFTVVFPVCSEGEWGSLYKRCGYSCDLTQSFKSCLAVNFEHISIDTQEEPSCEETAISFRNILLYAISPETLTRVGKHARQFDILALCGRTEVEPCIPVSIRLLKKATKLNDNEPTMNPGGNTFPKVSPMSSFKARQEDDDDDNRIDRILCSKIRDVDVSTRKQLRGADPQAAMLSNACQSDLVVVIDVPGFFCDLTVGELVSLNEMGLAVFPSKIESTDREATAVQNHRPQRKHVAFAFVCETVSLSIHEDMCQNGRPNSFVVKAEQVKTHAVTNTGKLEQTRFVVHDFLFCEGEATV